MARKTTFTEEQITLARRQADAGLPVEDVCRQLGISRATIFRWEQRYGERGTAEVRRLRQREDGNKKLKPLVADLRLDKKRRPDVLGKKLRRRRPGGPSPTT